MAGEIETRLRGFLSADADVKHTSGGREVVELSVAVNVTKRPQQDGDPWIDVRTDWARVSVWGALAASVRELKKGTLVVVEGRLTPGAYISGEGEAKPSTDVTADAVFIVPRARVSAPQETAAASA